MPEFTKREIFAEAREKIAPITTEVEHRKKKIIENAAVLISFSIISLSIILYAFNSGFCKVFNLPPEVMSLDMTRMIPLAIQILSIATCGLLYFSSVKADRALQKNRIDFVRIIWGAFIISSFFSMNKVPEVIGKWWDLALICLIPIAMEVLQYFYRKPKKERIVTEAEHDFVLEDTIRDSIFATYYIKYGLYLILLPLIVAPYCGEFSAKAEREYQTCIVQDTTYAVIVDYSDKVLAQKATVEANLLSIDTTSYIYFDKNEIALQYSKFDSVKICSGKETVQPLVQNNLPEKTEEVLSVPTITDWIMVVITGIYVVATIFICIYNGRSAKATREQVAETQLQFEETKRLERMPYIDISPAERPEDREIFDSDVTLSFAKQESEELICDIQWLEFRNIGYGTAIDLSIEWIIQIGEPEKIMLPTKILEKERRQKIGFCVNLVGAFESVPQEQCAILLLRYKDLLGNCYTQEIKMTYILNSVDSAELKEINISAPRYENNNVRKKYNA